MRRPGGIRADHHMTRPYKPNIRVVAEFIVFGFKLVGPNGQSLRRNKFEIVLGKGSHDAASAAPSAHC